MPRSWETIEEHKAWKGRGRTAGQGGDGCDDRGEPVRKKPGCTMDGNIYSAHLKDKFDYDLVYFRSLSECIHVHYSKTSP